MAQPVDEAQAKQLLSAVERLVTSNDKIREQVAMLDAKVRSSGETLSKSEVAERIAKELTRSASNRAAIAGGAVGLPALIPGIGSLAAGLGGTLIELAYLLKSEVELTLALAHVYDFDIDDPRERQLCFLLAAVGTYDANGKNFFADIARAQGVAIWNYGPRVGSRMLLQALALIAGFYVWRGFVRMVPVLGIAVGSGLNKVLTQRVGARVSRDLRTRRQLLDEEVKPQKKTVPRKRRAPPKLKVVAK